MITKEWIDTIDKAIKEACPLVSNDQKSIGALTAKVQAYDRELGCPPAESMVITWAVPFEQELLRRQEDANAEQNRAIVQRASRRKERVDYLGDSRRDKAAMLEEHAARQAKREEIPPFTPERVYSPQELDAMSADEYKERVLGVESLGLNSYSEAATQELKEVHQQRILKSRKNDAMSAAIRRDLRRTLAK